MMIELLAGPLVGETASFASKERDSGDGGPPQGGQFILAMNPEILSGGVWQEQSEEFIKRLGELDGVRLPAQTALSESGESGEERQIKTSVIDKIRSMT